MSDLRERLAAYAVWVFQTAGYWIRPYDMIADRRRWFWQPRQRCGGVIYLPAELPPADTIEPEEGRTDGA